MRCPKLAQRATELLLVSDENLATADFIPAMRDRFDVHQFGNDRPEKRDRERKLATHFS
jgi:hypothetical protein